MSCYYSIRWIDRVPEIFILVFITFNYRYDAQELVAKIKPLTKLIAEDYLKEVMNGYLKSPLIKNNSLMLWTALAETICELKCDISKEILRNMLILPLKSMSLFTSVSI